MLNLANQNHSKIAQTTNGFSPGPKEPVLMTALRAVDSASGAFLFGVGGWYFHFSSHVLWGTSLLIFLFGLFIFHALGVYRSWRFASLRSELILIWGGCLILYGFLFTLLFLFGIAEQLDKRFLIAWMVLWPSVISVQRLLARTLLRFVRQRGLNLRRAVICGGGDVAEKFSRMIAENPWSGTKILGYFDDGKCEALGNLECLGKLSDLPAYVKRKRLDIVYFALPLRAEEKMQELLRELSDTTVSVYFLPDMFFLDLIIGGNLAYFEDIPVIALQDTAIQGVNMAIKRVEDIVLSIFFLILASPFLLAISLALLVSSRQPVLFKQWRYGLNGKRILMYKFRTMTVCEDGYDFCQATKNDQRVTRLGAFLRRTSLDELPQLVNVLQGRMSLVGPRPHPVALNEEFRKLVAGYMLRHKVKPGITGLAQIHGFRGETDTLEKMEARIEYDLEYLRRWSLWADIKIIVKTIFSGAWKTNAY